MAENKETKKTTEKVFIPKPQDTKDKAAVVGFNGTMYTVPYDIETEVPVGVYEVIKSSKKHRAFAQSEQERLIGNQKMNA